jgi:hypothetical protein
MHRARRCAEFRCPSRILAGAFIFAVAVFGAATARGSVISSAPDPLPPSSAFVTTGGGAGCFPNVGVCVEGGTLSDFSNIKSTFDSSGQELDFSGVFTATLTDLANNPLGTISLGGSIGERIFGRTGTSDLGTWDTQIQSLDLTGTLGGIGLHVLQDSDNPSLGQTTIAQFGEKFATTSLFDIFVEIEFFTVPPLMTGRGPLHVELEPIREPAGLGLFVLSLFGLAAVRGLLRRV